MTDDWYSDAALAKQAELDRRHQAGEPMDWTLMAGMLEPRTQPTEAERCRHCRMDARIRGGGDGRFCGLCLSRGKDEDYDHEGDQ